jgi:hypothetical protein
MVGIRLLASLPILAATFLIGAVATLAQIALATPPLAWPTSLAWLLEPRNLVVLSSGLIAGLSAVAAFVQIFGAKSATQASVTSVAEGVGHVSKQVRAEAAASEVRDAQLQSELKAMPAAIADQLLPQMRELVDRPGVSQVKDVELNISIKLTFRGDGPEVDVGVNSNG